MENTNKNQEDSNIFRIYKLLKKTCIRTNQENGNSYTINEERIEMTIRIIRRRNVSIN